MSVFIKALYYVKGEILLGHICVTSFPWKGNRKGSAFLQWALYLYTSNGLSSRKCCKRQFFPQWRENTFPMRWGRGLDLRFRNKPLVLVISVSTGCWLCVCVCFFFPSFQYFLVLINWMSLNVEIKCFIKMWHTNMP